VIVFWLTLSYFTQTTCNSRFTTKNRFVNKLNDLKDNNYKLIECDEKEFYDDLYDRE
jgi:hypothetical protein